MSDWIGWVILAVYVLGYAASAPALTRVFANEFAFREGEPDRSERVLAAVAGMFIALFWPLVIPLGWIYRRAFGRRS